MKSMFDRALDNGPLTNRKIDKYALDGNYGPEIQRRWLAAKQLKQIKQKKKPCHDLKSLE